MFLAACGGCLRWIRIVALPLLDSARTAGMRLSISSSDRSSRNLRTVPLRLSQADRFFLKRAGGFGVPSEYRMTLPRETQS
jgi:hypothetical protein